MPSADRTNVSDNAFVARALQAAPGAGSAPLRSLLGQYDHVTLLPNRVQILRHLAGILEDVKQEGRAYTVIMVTLAEAQHFNEILRALGHAFSEEFIRTGAHRVAESLPPGSQLFNVSVLSFAFVVDRAATPSPQETAAEIAGRFEQPIVVQDIPIRTSTGIGLIDLTSRVVSPAEVLRAALTAAQASRRSYDAYAHYDAQSDAAHRRVFQLLTDLPDALCASDQLYLQFQPRIDVRTDACIGVEALLRWQHPQLGRVPPDEFIPLVETTALIKPLTRYVLDVSIRQLKAWCSAGGKLRLSMNVSPRNLSEPDFLDTLSATLQTHDVAPSLLELEITEGAISGDDAMALEHLRRVRALGIEIAIDDFGSGYSNMAYLTKIPADIVKIDRGFIQNIERDEQSRFLVKKIAKLAMGLGFKVVGEGVETAVAYGLLGEIGCHEAQGFYFSRPLSLEALERWVGKRNP